ncbi:MAG: phosphomannomutase/phosphoglucomutase [Nitrospinae bacterium]|nr:phosphomannomutase/phosphoglucomutase [Nitrospinota bacterium]
MHKNLNPEIFRESDIRGLVKEDLAPEFVQSLGKAIGTLLRRMGGKTLTLGRDVRPSSYQISYILEKGILSTGCNVIDIGTIPTPLSYFSQYHLDCDGGVMITGSHNPAAFNGFKITIKKNSIYGKTIRELYRIILENDFETGKGWHEAREIKEAYLQTLQDKFHFSRSIQMVVDGGNGCFGLVGPELLGRLGMEPVEIFCEPDGDFPNHHPDPTVEKNLVDLIQRVKDENAEIGIGFDGDVDRIGVIDDKGDIMWGDHLLTLFSRHILKRHPGATIVGEVKCSQNLFNDIKEKGGIPIMTAAGHSLIKKKMRETNALLAGEMSGHIFFADDYYGYDDAIYAACRLLEILDNSKERLSELLIDLPKTFYTPEIRIDCPDQEKFGIVKELAKYFTPKYNVVDIDGIRINFPDGWALIRASNTQPVLVLRFEAESKARLKEIQELISEQLARFDCIEFIQQVQIGT